MKLLIVTLIILAGLVLIGFTHARGDECYTIEPQVALANSYGFPVYVAKWHEVPKIVKLASDYTHESYGRVMRALVIIAPNGALKIGLEVDGCLLPPIVVPPKAKAVGLGA